MSSRISPDEPFPADLGRLRDQEVEVLNSKVHREIEHEWAEDGDVDPETASRKDEITDELDDRDAGPRLTLVPRQDDAEGYGEDEGGGRATAALAGSPNPARGGTGAAGGA
ncbi:hypothetical protein ACX80J_07460 [Arthrobacter sp. MDB2-24]